ncbi:Peptidyl-prolyl cis-trans isomerase D [Novipirellula aureliae]|uniref:Periplasmic chaperone PpiD n=1 Tax=Novipirellula aureliae TaxID=2527966 RepID=A0A5C6EAM9_9BACT|nr:peptidylprolyl isomerase [Novipirellula aureliae]TWU45544.1 Peptidyl-prolyl cis-trans isomerase D [Novipirellula aureliae]
MHSPPNRPSKHARVGRPFGMLAASLMLGLLASEGFSQAPTSTDVQAALAIQLPKDPAAILAVVGQSKIFLNEISPKVEARINEVLEKTDQEIPDDQLRFARVSLTRNMLRQAIQTKMMRECFLLDQVATQNADKRNEADAMLAARARQMFYESELPQLQKQYKVQDLGELDALLREKGSSLSARQREFADAMLGHLYIKSKVVQDPNVSIAEITQYYQENHDEFAQPAAAKWEQLSVLFSQIPDRNEATAAISEMGREAYFGGNMQAVAKAKSQEPFASKGGLHDWTTQGALASEILDQQIFSLPLNAMSEIIVDDTGMHIIRVLDRRGSGFTPLSEVQDEIRAKIREAKIVESQKSVLKEMSKRIPIWTLFPDDFPDAKPLPKSIVSRHFESAPETVR